MRAHEFITDGKLSAKIMRDNIGGFVQIHPDPDTVTNMDRFSIVYINNDMANYYGISPRIIGMDSHGHVGLKEPHLHLFQKSKLKGYLDIDQKEFDFALALNIFYDLLNTVKQKYKDDINEKN